MSPSVLTRRFPPGAHFVDLVRRMRCGDDGIIPDVWLILDDESADHEAMRAAWTFIVRGAAEPTAAIPAK